MYHLYTERYKLCSCYIIIQIRICRDMDSGIHFYTCLECIWRVCGRSLFAARHWGGTVCMKNWQWRKKSEKNSQLKNYCFSCVVLTPWSCQMQQKNVSTHCRDAQMWSVLKTISFISGVFQRPPVMVWKAINSQLPVPSGCHDETWMLRLPLLAQHRGNQVWFPRGQR